MEKHIAELLLEHECVIVPEFGGFISNPVHSKLSTHTHDLTPPSRKISFNRSLSTNDGLLANALKAEEAINYADALDAIREEVLSWKSRLESSGRLEIQGVGTIFIRNEQWQFRQNEESNFELDAFGLKPVHLTPIPVEKLEAVAPEKEAAKVVQLEPSLEEDTIEDEKVIHISEEPKRRTGRKIALIAACAIPIAFYMYWIPMHTSALDRGYIKGSDLNPFNTAQTQATYSSRSHKVDDIQAVEIEESDSDHLVLEDKTYVVAEKPVEVISTAPVGSYHVIGGCFQNLSNAEGLVADLTASGYPSYIIDQNNGLHRVCIQTFPTQKAAASFMRDLRGKGVSGWVLKK